MFNSYVSVAEGMCDKSGCRRIDIVGSEIAKTMQHKLQMSSATSGNPYYCSAQMTLQPSYLGQYPKMIQLFQTPLKKHHQTAVIWGYYGIYIYIFSCVQSTACIWFCPRMGTPKLWLFFSQKTTTVNHGIWD